MANQKGNDGFHIFLIAFGNILSKNRQYIKLRFLKVIYGSSQDFIQFSCRILNQTHYFSHRS